MPSVDSALCLVDHHHLDWMLSVSFFFFFCLVFVAKEEEDENGDGVITWEEFRGWLVCFCFFVFVGSLFFSFFLFSVTRLVCVCVCSNGLSVSCRV